LKFNFFNAKRNLKSVKMFLFEKEAKKHHSKFHISQFLYTERYNQISLSLRNKEIRNLGTNVP